MTDEASATGEPEGARAFREHVASLEGMSAAELRLALKRGYPHPTWSIEVRKALERREVEEDRGRADLAVRQTQASETANRLSCAALGCSAVAIGISAIAAFIALANLRPELLDLLP